MATLTLSDTLLNRLQTLAEQKQLSVEALIEQSVDDNHNETELEKLHEEPAFHANFYRSVVTVMGEGVIIRNARRQIIDCNPSAERILGIPREQLIHQGDIRKFKAVQREDKTPFPKHEAPATIVLEKGEPQYNVISSIVAPDGTQTWVSTNTYPVFLSDGDKPDYAVSVFTDITEYRRATKEAEKTAAYWRYMSELSFEGLAITEDHIVKDVNNRLLEILGYERDEFIGMRDMDFVVESDKDYVQSKSLEKESLPYEHLAVRKDGRVILVEIQGKTLQDSDRRIRVVAIRDVTQQRKVEHELEKTRALLAAAIEQSPAGIIIADVPDLDIQLVNQTAMRIRGYDAAAQNVEKYYDLEAWRTTYADGTLYPIDQLPLVRAAFGEIVQDEEMLNGDGRWVIANAAPIRNNNGEIIASIAVFLDITARKRAEEALRRSEERYRNLLEAAPVAVAVIRFDTDKTPRFAYANPATVELYGAKQASDLVGLSLLELSTTERQQVELRQRADAYIDGEQKLPPREVELIRLDGRTGYVTISSVAIEYEGQPAVMSVVTDITDKYLAEEAVRRSEERYRNLLESSPVAIAVIRFEEDKTPRFVYVNPGAVDLYGAKQASDIVGLSVLDMTAPEHHAKLRQRADAYISGERKVSPTETKIQRLDGRISYTAISSVAIEYEGQPAVMSVITDMTEKYLAEEALRRSEERYRHLLDSAPVAITLSQVGRDKVAEIVYANTAAVSLYGVQSAQDLYGKGYLHYLPTPYQDTAVRRSAEFGLSHNLDAAEYTIQRPDDAVRHVRTASSVITYNEQPAILSVMVDVTERYTAEQALRQSEERYRNLLELSPAAITVNQIEADNRLRIVYANPMAMTLYGAKEVSDLIDHMADEFIAHDYLNVSQQRTQDLIGGVLHPPVEYKMRRMDGMEITTLVGSILIDYEGQPAFLSVFNDVSERKQMEIALRQSEDRYRRMLENAPVGIFVVQMDGKATIRYINPTGAAMLAAKNVTDIIGLSSYDLMPPESLAILQQRIDSLTEGQETPIREYALKRMDEGQVYVRAAAIPITYDDQPSALMVLIDVTERRKAEEALIRRDAILNAVAFAADQFLRNRSPEESMQAVLERLGQAAQADRSYIFTNHISPDGIPLRTQIAEWVAPGISVQQDNPLLKNKLKHIPGWEAWHQGLESGQVVSSHTKGFPLDVQDFLREQEIQSLVAAPIFTGQYLWGSIGLDMCRSEREWSQVEKDALKTAAEILGAAIERKQDEDTQREREIRINRQNEALLQLATVKALGSGDLDAALREITRVTSETMAVGRVSIWFYVDGQSAIICELGYVSTNETYESGSVLREQQYPAYFTALRQNRIIVAHDAYTDLATHEFAADYLPTHGIVSMLDAPIRVGGKTVGIICSEQVGTPYQWSLDDQHFIGGVADLVALAIESRDRQLAQEALLHSEEAALEFQQKLKQLHEVTIELAQQSTLEDIYRRAVELGRSVLGFDRLGLWVLNSTRDKILGTFGTDEIGQTRDERPLSFPLTAISPDVLANFKRNERIISIDKFTIITPEFSLDPDRWIRVALLWNGTEGIGWLTADNYISRAKPRSYEIDLLIIYASALGSLITQRQAEETALAFQTKLRQIHEIGLELSQEKTLLDIYRRAVELGRSKLDFDRFGLFLIVDEAQGIVRGTFGTDENGQLRDESDYSPKLADDDGAITVIRSKERAALWENTALKDSSREVGTGWTAMAALWNGSEAIGWLVIDNLLSQKPPRHYELDLLTVYATALGSLITQRQAEENALAFQEKLRQVHEVTLELAQQSTLADIYRRAVELGRSVLGFDRLGLWVLNPERDKILGTFGTDEIGQTRDERELAYPLKSIYPEVLEMFKRKERIISLTKGFIEIPEFGVNPVSWVRVAILWNGSEGIGWLSADNYIHEAEPRSYEFDLLTIYATALGSLITQRQAEETALAFQNKLRQVHEIAVELSQEQTLTDVYRRAVELGRTRLEFDRLGLWLMDKNANILQGTFGTDEAGNLRDETANVHLISDDAALTEALNSQQRSVYWQNGEIKNHQLQSVANGWKALTFLWNGAEDIGCLSTDNFLTKRASRSYEMDLLTVYGTSLGHLITQRRSQEALQRSEEAALEFQQKLRQLHEITLELAQQTSLTDIYRLGIELGRRVLGFDRLGLWVLSSARDKIQGTFGTDEMGQLRDEQHYAFPLEAITPDMLAMFERHERIVSHDSWFINYPGFDIDTDNWNKEARLWTRVALLWNGSEGIGWLSTDNYVQKAEPRPYEFDLLIIYATALGSLITQRQAEENALAFQEKLRQIHEIAVELSQEKTLVAIYRRAVELARSRLEFDRLGLWLMDKNANTLQGTFGTDEVGQLRDESSIIHIIPKDSEVSELLNNKQRSAFWEQRELQNHQRETVANGWKAVTFLWDGVEDIGCLFTDNFLSKRPPRSYEMDLLTVYGTSLGHLITQRRSQEALQYSEETALAFQQKLREVHEITLELAQQSTLADIYRRAVELGRGVLGFDRLGLWVLNSARDKIQGTFGTDEMGQLRDERHVTSPLETIRPEVLEKFKRNDRIISHGRWLIKPLGLDSGNTGVNYWARVATLWNGSEGIGWLSADNVLSQAPPRPYELDLLTIYAAALGSLITQRQTEENALAFQEKLRQIHEITFELNQEKTLLDVYRRAVELGRNTLGFDRLGLWLSDNKNQMIQGTFGIDENGNLRDETASSQSASEVLSLMEVIQSQQRTVSWSNADLLNHTGEIVAKGWKAATFLWNGTEDIGWLSTDNLLSQRPPRSYEVDLLTVYGTSLGYLVTQRRSQEALQRSEETALEFQQKLREVHEITLELAQQPALTDIYRRAVELGRSVLGFERLGLWVLNSARDKILGTFGTDAYGQIRDEQHFAFSLDKVFPEVLEKFNRKERIISLKDGMLDIPNFDVETDGWVCAALLWNGSDALGWLSADNYIHKAEPRPYEFDLLTIYAASLGSLITQRQSEETALAFQEKLRQVHEITLELSQQTSLNDIYRRAVELGRSVLDFDRLDLWLLNTARDTVHGTFGTDESGKLLDARHIDFPFERSSSELIETLTSKKRILIRENSAIRNEYGRVIGEGWNAVSILWNGNEGIGWLATDNFLGKAKPRPYEYDLLTVYATALGGLITQRRTQEALQRSEEIALEFQQKLRQVHEITVELAQQPSLADIYRRAVELGRSELGYERLGLWILNSSRDIIVGTFGTDEQGQTRDEQHLSFALADVFPNVLDVFKRKERIISQNGGVINHGEYTIDPTGWNVVAILWNGTEGIGWLSADNYLNKTPLRPYEHDLLTIYATALGSLITQRQSEEQLTNLVSHLTLLGEIDRAILRADSHDTIAASIVQPMKILMECDYVSIIVGDMTSKMLRMIAHTDDTPLFENVMMGEFAEQVALSLAQGKTVQANISNLPAYGELIAYMLHRGLQWIVVLPLVYDDTLVGTLNLGSVKAQPFNSERIQLAEQVTTQLSVALRQSMLYQQVQDYAESLEHKVAARTHQLEEKANEMEAFSYSISHDLRAPLRAINGFSDLLMEAHSAELSEKVLHYLDRIHSNSRRMGELIDDLLTLSRIGRAALRKQLLATKPLVQGVLSEMQADFQTGAAVIVVDELPHCYADSALLKQVYVNLVSNAIKYSQNATTPIIQIGYEVDDEGQTVYYVRDNGVGFDMKYSDKLFGVFQRLHDSREYEGTGIGLATVQRIINRHGGKVWAKAQVNEGATFYFTLPAGTDEDTDGKPGN